MKYERTLYSRYLMIITPIVLGALVSLPCMGQAKKNLAVDKPGEIILYMQPGVPQGDVKTLTDTVQATQLVPLLLPDCYKVVLPAANHNDQDTAAAVAKLHTDARVKWVNANLIGYSTQASAAPKVTPNDPRYPEQWGMQLINMPQAWVLQKGVKDVNVAVIDTGFDPNHEDLMNRYSPASFNFADNDTNITPNGAGPTNQHGVHVSGIIVANANNNIGVASVTWQNTLCVGLKGTARADTNNGFPLDVVVNCLQFCVTNKDKQHIAVINMSIEFQGTPANDTTFPLYVAAKNVLDAGIIIVCAAGNESSNNSNDTPSGFTISPLLITVAAVGQTGKQSSFSNFGKIDVAAPGGDFDNGNAGQILSTLDSAYGVESGTSQASPHVAGVCTLLMSIPGVTPLNAVNTLRSTANHQGLGTLPDVNYGFGTVDAFAAISRLSVRAVVTAPDGLNSQGQSSDPSNILPPPVETFKPAVSFHINNIACDNVTFTLDASIPSLTKVIKLSDLVAGNIPPGITDFSIVGACTGVSNPQYDVSFRVIYPTSGFFQHTVTVNGTDPNSGISASDTRIFTITPHVIPAGLSMISIPYFESANDAPPPYTGQFRDVPQLLGTTPTLFRYLLPSEIGSQPGKVSGAYAKYTASDPAANINASFRPLNSAPETSPQLSTASGQPLDTRPVGLGFFIDAPAAISVVDFGVPIPTTPFRIPLHEGWNMVGDPYPFSIPFNSTEIETSNGARIPTAQAVDQGLLLPHIYRLVGGDYQFRTLPDGTLEAWEGHWIYVNPKDPANLNASTVLYLITTPTPIAGTSGRAATTRSAASTPTRAAGAGSWTVQLQAHVADQNDTNNFIGMSAAATDGNDKTKVPKPPKPTDTVSLGIVRSNSPASIYAQDLRPIGGTKQWDVVVTTDKPNSTVTLDWGNARSLPRTYRLILTDKVTGQTVDLRNTSSYQFNSGPNPGTRGFSLVARPTNSISGHAVFSNVVVNPGRGADGRATNIFDIGYTVSGDVHVSVSILTLGGRQLAQVGTSRAVTSGDNHVTWNGRDNAGRAVPAGSYVLQLQAVTTDGQTTRVIQPLILTGR